MNRSKGYLLVLVTLFAFLSWQLIAPFLQYVLLAVLLGFVLFPLQERLEKRVSPTIAAFSLILLAIVGFIVPFALVVAVAAGDATAIVQNVDQESLQLSVVESWIAEQTGMNVDLASRLSDAAQQAGSVALEQATTWFGTVTHALVGFGLALFLLYYFLRDGTKLLDWIRSVTPLPADVQDDLYRELDEVMWAVLAGHVLIAMIQGAIAGIGLFAVGIPNAAFWTFIMIVLGLIPLIGTFLVWGPAVGYLLVTGEPILAVALLVYSTVIVGISDDYLRPVVVDRYAEISPAVILIGVLGGVYAFGVMGLFFGPVVVGAFIAVVEVVDDNYERLEESDPT